MHGLDLFSGIGGITKALEGWVRPVAYCERDRYAQGVLLSRMADGSLPEAPIWDDVRTLEGRAMPPVDIIYGGFPCQDISVAGRGAGLAGERSGLFFEIVRLIGEIRPAFVFLENVPAVRLRGGSAVAGELARLGYDARWITLSAADVGANHQRERWFLLAHARRVERESGAEVAGAVPEVHGNGAVDDYAGGSGADVADAESAERRTSDPGGCRVAREGGLPQREETAGRTRNGGQALADPERPGWRATGNAAAGEASSGRAPAIAERSGWWSAEPDMGRVAHGVPFRVDRLRALGNSVVPAQAREAFERLMGLK